MVQNQAMTDDTRCAHTIMSSYMHERFLLRCSLPAGHDGAHDMAISKKIRD